MNELNTTVNEIQKAIFSYQIAEVSGKIFMFIERMSTWTILLALEEQIIVNQILGAVLKSYENKDYLLLADLLEFELKPLL